MSCYVHFYLRSPHDDFVELGEFSRNSAVYELCGDVAPYEKITALSKTALTDFCSEADRKIKEYKDRIKQYRDAIAAVGTFNDPIEDKLEAIADYQYQIGEVEDEIERIQWASSFLYTLCHIIDTNEYEDGVDITKLVYFGCEISSPTVADIKE